MLQTNCSESKCHIDPTCLSKVDESNIDEAVEFMLKYYWTRETSSRAVDLHNRPWAVAELKGLTKWLASTGLSLCYKVNGEIAAVSVNIIQAKSAPHDNIMMDFKEKCKDPSSKAIIDFIIDLDNYNELIYKQENIDCFLEIVCLATADEHTGKGFGTYLIKKSIEIAMELKAQKSNILKPQGVVADCTTSITKRLTEKLGFNTVLDLSLDAWTFEGKSFTERVLPDKAILKYQLKKL